MSNLTNPTPWVVQAAGEAVPNGSYFAEFVSVEPYANPAKGIEGKWRWVWTIVSGQNNGKTLSALTDQRITPNTHSGRLISGMNGKPFAAGDDLQQLVAAFKGRKFLCTQSPGPQGGKPSVQSVSLPPEM